MKKTAIISTALCLSLLAAGCTGNEPTQGTEPSATTEDGGRGSALEFQRRRF